MRAPAAASALEVRCSPVSPALRAALRDPVVEAARRYELLMIAVLTYLMVTRPF